MKTLNEQYQLIKEGKGHKGVFLKEAKSMFPNYVRNAATFDEVSLILKQKGIINENIVGLSPINTIETKKESFETAFEKFLAEAAKSQEESDKATAKTPSKQVEEKEEKTSKPTDKKEDKNFDNMIFDQIMTGYYAEMKDPKNVDKTMQELKDIVLKNLSKDPIYYVKDGQFGVKGLGYTTEHPGLGTPKEAKGKYKSSGYGDLKENKLTSPQLGQLKMGDKVKYLGKDTNGFVNGEQYEVSRTESNSTFQPTITIKNKDGKKLRTSNLSKVLNEDPREKFKSGVKQAFSPSNKPKPTQDQIKINLEKKRKEELKRRASEKNIREVIRSIVQEEISLNEDAIIGIEIFDREPFSMLPQTRKDIIDFKTKLNLRVPSLRTSDALQSIWSKQDMISYINEFKDKFNEDPMFIIDDKTAFISNPKYMQYKKSQDNNKFDFLKGEREIGRTSELDEEIDEVRGGGNYGILSINTSNIGGAGGKRFIPTVINMPLSLRKKFGEHMIYNPGSETFYISQILYNNLIKGYANEPTIKRLIMDIPPMLKQLLNKTENYGQPTELPKQFKKYLPFKEPVEKAKEDKFNKAGTKQYWSAGDFLFPNLNKEKYTPEELKEQLLRNIIRESVEKELVAINKEAESEVISTKLEKIGAAIEKRQSQLNKLDEDEDMKALTDKTKIKQAQKDIKTLEKAKAKLEKDLSKIKKNNKDAVSSDIIDEDAPIDEAMDDQKVDKVKTSLEDINKTVDDISTKTKDMFESENELPQDIINQAIEMFTNVNGNTDKIIDIASKFPEYEDAVAEFLKEYNLRLDYNI
jgi:hypothetical protein